MVWSKTSLFLIYLIILYAIDCSAPIAIYNHSIRVNSIYFLLMLVWVLPAVAMGAFVGMLSLLLLPPMHLPCPAPSPSSYVPVRPTVSRLTCLVWPLPSFGWYSTNVSGWLLHFTRLGVALKTALLCGPPAPILTLRVFIVVLRHVFDVLCRLRANKLVQFSSVQIVWTVGSMGLSFLECLWIPKLGSVIRVMHDRGVMRVNNYMQRWAQLPLFHCSSIWSVTGVLND
jgi:hypothetical protein